MHEKRIIIRMVDSIYELYTESKNAQKVGTLSGRPRSLIELRKYSTGGGRRTMFSAGLILAR